MTSVPDTVQRNIVQILERQSGKSVSLQQFSFTGGGCINHGGRLKTSSGDFFVKWNSAAHYPKMFEAEASGLGLLKRSTSLHGPAVIGWFEADEYQGILLDFVESKTKKASYWEDLGKGLASLHRNSNETFGLDRSNYIGSLPQSNEPRPSWIEFFIHQRLSPQLELAFDSHHFDKSILKQFEHLYTLLPSVMPVERPALIHGDLWSGNLITNSIGAPCLIDPAVYYGHREAELAFTQLFGGFDRTFYSSYDDAFKLSSGFQNRVDLYNLYPLLVHVNLFGGGYVGQASAVLKKYS